LSRLSTAAGTPLELEPELALALALELELELPVALLAADELDGSEPLLEQPAIISVPAIAAAATAARSDRARGNVCLIFTSLW
jgi:hypothetical protein